MFWFDKQHPATTYMDIREHYEELSSGHVINVKPDVVADFRNMPFEDNTYDLVVFDPPHLLKAGDNSWLAKKYGRLDVGSWKDDIAKGFSECFRVLKPTGTLIFKWNEEQVKLKDVLAIKELKRIGWYLLRRNSNEHPRKN